MTPSNPLTISVSEDFGMCRQPDFLGEISMESLQDEVLKMGEVKRR